MILSHFDIVILPFEGQSSTEQAANKTTNPIRPTNQATAPRSGLSTAPVRKQVMIPTGKLATTNIGIKDTLNPPSKKTNEAEETVRSNEAEDFTYNELERVWKAYSLEVKRNKKDSLYSTLQSKMTMSSDYQIHLELVNTVQAAEIEKEKVELLGFIRSQLRNYSVGLSYSIIDAPKVQILDSRGVFEKLTADNSSLDKFRKLFNLDIEF